MTSLDSSAAAGDVGRVPQDASARPLAEKAWALEALLERLGEWLNPILVKEARQSLKSRQFLVTFILLLSCGWAWSLLGVALLSPAVYYAPGGHIMLAGYYFVLAAPVLVIAPFSAFRSMAAEREDGTFELVSITTLKSRQIVTGKLGSAVLQMMVYYSAIAPCIAFTYLLRGIDVITIAVVLFYTFMISLLLASAGLMLATMTRSRAWQAVLSVKLVIWLLAATVAWSSAVMAIIFSPATPYAEPEFWVAQLALISFGISFLVLFVLTASAQISFASDNRSTRLRVVMLAQQLLWIGWMTFLWLNARDDDVLYVMMGVGAAYWFFMGSLLTGEAGRLSPRVKRSLPQSFLGRMAFTWFNPGAGTGYAFAVTNLGALLLVVAILGLWAQVVAFRGAPGTLDWMRFGLLATGYVAACLGTARLLVLLMRQFFEVGMFVPFLINVFLAVVACAVPVFLQAWWYGYGNLDYSTLQASNWIWTLAAAAEGNLGLHPRVPALVLAAAAVIFVLNLVFAMREVRQVHEATPQRVLDDEIQLHPAKAPRAPVPKSPWD